MKGHFSLPKISRYAVYVLQRSVMKTRQTCVSMYYGCGAVARLTQWRACYQGRHSLTSQPPVLQCMHHFSMVQAVCMLEHGEDGL